jgi:prepilin-type N-terminal cleavage/methylation domain-containing protein
MLARIRKAQEESEGGFTLIELLVVIIIIGILAAIAIPVFLNQRKKAVDASIKSDLRTAATALETYFTDNQAYNAATGQNPKFSQGNKVEVAVTATGYCLRGSNANSDATGAFAAPANYFWYDSTGGGLQSGAPTLTSNSVGGTGSTCTGAGTYTAVS